MQFRRVLATRRARRLHRDTRRAADGSQQGAAAHLSSSDGRIFESPFGGGGGGGGGAVVREAIVLTSCSSRGVALYLKGQLDVTTCTNPSGLLQRFGYGHASDGVRVAARSARWATSASLLLQSRVTFEFPTTNRRRRRRRLSAWRPRVLATISVSIRIRRATPPRHGAATAIGGTIIYQSRASVRILRSTFGTH